MTNATVDNTVASVDGQVVMVKYKDGEKKIIVPPEATIRAYVVGDKSELKPGAAIADHRRDQEAGRHARNQPRECRPRRHHADSAARRHPLQLAISAAARG